MLMVLFMIRILIYTNLVCDGSTGKNEAIDSNITATQLGLRHVWVYRILHYVHSV